MRRTLVALAVALLLCGCATAPGQAPAPSAAPVVEALGSKQSAVACQAADLLTTKAAFGRGAVEGNPLVGKLISSGGWPAVIALKGALVWWLLRDETPPEARAAASVLTCGVAAHNMGVR